MTGKRQERFADNFRRTILGWADPSKPLPTINCRVDMMPVTGLLLFRFTLGGKPEPFSFGRNCTAVLDAIQRARTIAPKCRPGKGDLAVFDGTKILMFRRRGESLSKPAAVKAAKEVASYMLMQRARQKPAAARAGAATQNTSGVKQ